MPWAQGSALSKCPCTALTWPALQGGPVRRPASLSSLIWRPLSTLALSHPSHSSHSGQMDLFKMQIATCHPSVQIPLMESLLASQCHFQPPGSCRSGPSRPFCLFSLLITLLAFPCSLTVPYSLQSQDLCTCCSLNLAPTSALVDTYSLFKS